MSQYLLFAGMNYYPGGGWNDFKGAFETIEEAVAEVTQRQEQNNTEGWDWYHVVDTTTGQEVA